MKRNFVVTVANQQEYSSLIKWAATKDYKWQSGDAPIAVNQRPEDFRKLLGVNFTGKVLSYSPAEWFASRIAEYGPHITFAAFAAIQGIELGPEPVKIRLGDYTAVVDYATSTVKVGCQTIPFSKVQEVAEATKKHDGQEEQGNAKLSAFKHYNNSECASALRNALRIGFGESATESRMQAVADYLRKYNFVLAEVKK